MVRKILALLGALVVGCALAFLWVDHRVGARLQNLHASTVPVIYSSSIDIAGLLSRMSYEEADPESRIRTLLASRRYAEVPNDPEKPGEFSLRNRRLTLVTREFRLPNGEMLPSRKVALSVDTGLAPGASASDIQPLLIEPQPVSYIGSEEVRASKFTPLSEIPLLVQRAVLAIEDERFYDHWGIDVIGIARAMVKNVMAMALVQGGSTLTQQLAKNMFLSPKRTFSRKIMEIPTALSLERRLSKDQLLELYLNEVYLGQEGAVALHGMPEAGSAFFGKRVQDLSIDEVATLAGIIKAPSYYSPRRHPDRAKDRRNIVLGKMKELAFITEDDYKIALRKPMKTVPVRGYRRVAPYFTTALEADLSQSIDIEAAGSAGISIFTGLDLGMQGCAERAVVSGLEKLEKSLPRLTKSGKHLEGALVALEPHSGLVKAWVGGRDYGESQFNRVSQATRQIGSTIKPFLYLTALDGTLNTYKVATATSILEDKPMSIEMKQQRTWVPENYDHSFKGDVTLRFALENSLNMPAIYIVERVGIPALQGTLSRFAISDAVPAVPSLALGALDTTLLRLTASYGALANSGVYVQPRLFIAATDEQGERLATSEIREDRVADENAVFVLSNILEGVLDRGTAKVVRTNGFLREAGGKTGTSDKTRDAWFVGYAPNLVAGVWVGLDDNSPTGLTGGAASAPIWAEFMKCSAPFLENVNFVPPHGITVVEVDSGSGELAVDGCPAGQRVREVFVSGTEPVRHCRLHGPGEEPMLREPRLPETERRRQPRDRSFWETIFG